MIKRICKALGFVCQSVPPVFNIKYSQINYIPFKYEFKNPRDGLIFLLIIRTKFLKTYALYIKFKKSREFTIYVLNNLTFLNTHSQMVYIPIAFLTSLTIEMRPRVQTLERIGCAAPAHAILCLYQTPLRAQYLKSIRLFFL